MCLGAVSVFHFEFSFTDTYVYWHTVLHSINNNTDDNNNIKPAALVPCPRTFYPCSQLKNITNYAQLGLYIKTK